MKDLKEWADALVDNNNKTAELKEFNEHISICIPMKEIQVYEGIDKLIEALEIPNSIERDFPTEAGVKEKSFFYKETKFLQLSECDGTYL